jgi:hypothetical protein
VGPVCREVRRARIHQFGPRRGKGLMGQKRLSKPIKFSFSFLFVIYFLFLFSVLLQTTSSNFIQI